MTLWSDQSWDDWVARYEQSHQHPLNRRCHRFGIPLVASSVLLVVPALIVPSLGWLAAGAFILGWAFQFIGHAYEGKPPEFLHDWRFLFVGLRWWLRDRFGHT
jgi:uncharacterized membrane protein YGL010W